MGKSWSLEYLPFRFCIGLWVAFILLICVATDASAVVCYITRFTEENFALLIAVIFIKSAIQKVFDLKQEFPLHLTEDCFCDPINETDKILYGKSIKQFVAFNETFSYNKYKCEFSSSKTNGTLIQGWQSADCHYKANVFLCSVLLVIGTFSITMGLKYFRSSNFFPTWVRRLLADFAVIVAMISMTGVDMWLDFET